MKEREKICVDEGKKVGKFSILLGVYILKNSMSCVSGWPEGFIIWDLTSVSKHTNNFLSMILLSVCLSPPFLLSWHYFHRSVFIFFSILWHFFLFSFLLLSLDSLLKKWGHKIGGMISPEIKRTENAKNEYMNDQVDAKNILNFFHMLNYLIM